MSISGAPNQAISVNALGVDVSIVLNEQVTSTTINSGSIRVSAAHVTLSLVGNVIADIRILDTEADITCSKEPVLCRVIDWDSGTQGVINGTPSGQPGTFALAIGSINGVPSGNFTYQDVTAGKLVKATSVTSAIPIVGTARLVDGSATVNGVSGFTYTLLLQDSGGGPLDTFSIALSDGYVASGNLLLGNITHFEQTCPTPR
ncbi:Hypothetical protein A7982_01504 [Minicystis rosea]|nr:Hypothetical protein A7982_01504 [Minicystis rosea]